MNKLINFQLLVVIFSLSTYASSDFEADTSFYSNIINNKQTESRIFGTSVNFYTFKQLSNSLKASVKAKAILETGSNNSQNNKDYSPTQKLSLNEALLEWAPYKFLTLNGGALNQAHYNSPLLLANTAFMGSSQAFHFTKNSYKIYFRLQQAIPNNDTLTQRYGGVDQGTPSVFIETLGFSIKNTNANFILEASQFSFNKLSNGVAYSSQFGGNRTTGVGEANTSFLYKFQGLNIYSSLVIPFKSIQLSVDLNYIHNNKAPTKRSNAYLVKTKLKYKDTSLLLDIYQVDSDASVSFYSSKEYGNNNRKGLAYGITTKIIDKLEISAKFYDNNIQNAENPYQSDSDNMALALNHIISY